MHKLLLFNCIFLIEAIKIQPNGPKHKKLAEMCFKEVLDRHFHITDHKISSVLLMTVLVTPNMNPPAYELQETFLKILNHAVKFPLEVVENNQTRFKSFEECINCPTTETKIFYRNFIEEYKSYITIIIVDSEEHFGRKLKMLLNLHTFDPKMKYFVYFASLVEHSETVASRILHKLKRSLIFNTVIMIPKNLKQFTFYYLELDMENSVRCDAKSTMKVIDECNEGVLMEKKELYFKSRLPEKDFKNCTISVLAMPMEPFVINETAGIEIEFLFNLGDMFNIWFNVTVMREASDWGEKVDGRWTSALGSIYNTSWIGIGNIAQDASYIPDFDFSFDYFSENIVWVVPIANYVPKYRILTVIFTWELWSICIGSILLYAILFYVSAKLNNKTELKRYKKMQTDIMFAFQILIASSIAPPKADLTRVFYLSLAIFNIIISSVYTSSLVYYLKNPIREKQIASTQDIMDANYGVGGFSAHRQMFNLSETTLDDKDRESRTREIFEKYELVEQEIDNMDYWLKSVAEDRDTCIVSSEFFINYLRSQMNNLTTDSEGRPKIYVIEKQLMSYSLSLLVKRGYPLLPKFNSKILYMTASGLFQKISGRYLEAIKRLKYMEKHRKSVTDSLTPHHLQGAFAFLVLGDLLALGVLVGEIFWKKFCGCYGRKNGKVEDVRRRRLNKVKGKVTRSKLIVIGPPKLNK